jgi:hypothetical protein
MNQGTASFARYAVVSIAISTLVMLAVVYPFLPGAYDPTAMPLSLTIQAGSAASLVFVPLGLAWFFAPRREFWFVRGGVLVCAMVAAVMALVAFAADSAQRAQIGRGASTLHKISTAQPDPSGRKEH